MELENMDSVYGGSRIADIIRSDFQEDTDVVVVLLGKSLENPPSPQFTHNWVNFEVGVAAGCKKPVWVFEDYKEFINFPVPYVTDYCLYDLDSVEHIQFIGDRFKTLYINNVIINPPRKIKCHLCNAQYNFWSNQTVLNCPVCRKPTSG
jgi:hypothetical protein